MADSHVRTLDDTQNQGKKLQTYENTVGADDVHSEAVTLTKSDGSPLTVDEVDGALATITFVHHEIHEGNHYTCVMYDGDVDIAGPKYIRLTTGATGVSHLTFTVSGDAGFLAELYEDPTLNAAGTGLTIVNNNRNSGNTSNNTAFEDSTTQAPNNDGDLLWSTLSGAGGNPNQSQSGASGAREEFMLKPSEDYLIKVTVLADNTIINVKMAWYEA